MKLRRVIGKLAIGIAIIVIACYLIDLSQ